MGTPSNANSIKGEPRQMGTPSNGNPIKWEFHQKGTSSNASNNNSIFGRHTNNPSRQNVLVLRLKKHSSRLKRPPYEFKMGTPSNGNSIKQIFHQTQIGTPSNGNSIKGEPHQMGTPSKGKPVKWELHQIGTPLNTFNNISIFCRHKLAVCHGKTKKILIRLTLQILLDFH